MWMILLLFIATWGTPLARKGHIGVVHNDHLYVMFGSGHSTEFYNDTWSKDLKDTDSQWKPLAMKPLMRWKSCGVVYNDSIWVYGGHTGDDHNYGKGYMNDLWRYDIPTNTWHEMLESDKNYSLWDKYYGGRRAHTCDLKDNTVYIYGGRDLRNKAYRHVITINLDTLEVGNVTCDCNTTLPDGRKGHVSSLILNQTYLFIQGGRSDLDYMTDAWIMELDTGAWTLVDNDTSVPGRNHHTAVYADRRVYIFGGRGGRNDTFFNDLLVYDETNQEMKVYNMTGSVPSARYLHSSAMHNSQMVVFAGDSIAGRQNDLYTLNIMELSWLLIIAGFELSIYEKIAIGVAILFVIGLAALAYRTRPQRKDTYDALDNGVA